MALEARAIAEDIIPSLQSECSSDEVSINSWLDEISVDHEEKSADNKEMSIDEDEDKVSKEVELNNSNSAQRHLLEPRTIEIGGKSEFCYFIFRY